MSVNCESTIRATDLASVTTERGGQEGLQKKRNIKREYMHKTQPHAHAHKSILTPTVSAEHLLALLRRYSRYAHAAVVGLLVYFNVLYNPVLVFAEALPPSCKRIKRPCSRRALGTWAIRYIRLSKRRRNSQTRFKLTLSSPSFPFAS